MDQDLGPFVSCRESPSMFGVLLRAVLFLRQCSLTTVHRSYLELSAYSEEKL